MSQWIKAKKQINKNLRALKNEWKNYYLECEQFDEWSYRYAAGHLHCIKKIQEIIKSVKVDQD
jgi:hypothetical protein